MRTLHTLAPLVTLALAACGAQPPRPALAPPAPLAVTVERAKPTPWSTGREVSAGLEPLRRAMPGTVLMGRVVKIVRHEGDRVKTGDLLAQVDARDVAAREAQAAAGVAAARAQEQNARLMRERMERLLSRQAASQRNVDDAVAGHTAALAALEAAEQGVIAAHALAGYADVRAPFAGTVVERHVEAGDIAAPGAALFVVEDRSKMKVEAQVSESTLAGLSVGSAVELAIESADPPVRQGTLAEILPSADPASRTVRVRVILDNTDESLRSGMYARLRLAGAAASRLSVAASAVTRRGPLAAIFVVDGGGVARLRYVTVGELRDGRYEVLTGLDPEERVVVAPPPALEDGRPVEAHE